MSRQTLENRDIRKLYRNSGGTVLVSIPKEIIRKLRWQDGQKVVVRQLGKKVLIEDWEG